MHGFHLMGGDAADSYTVCREKQLLLTSNHHDDLG